MRLDVVRGVRGVEDTIVSFAPLLDPDLPSAQLAAIMTDLRRRASTRIGSDGHVVPTYDLAAEGFDERRYWRGPVWINTNWLLWNGLVQHGQTEEADAILRSSLGLVARSGFREYFDPFGGEGFGTDRLRLDRGADARLHRASPGRRSSQTGRRDRPWTLSCCRGSSSR